MKNCNKCLEDKELDKFTKKVNKCKLCLSELKNYIIKNNREKIISKVKEYTEKKY